MFDPLLFAKNIFKGLWLTKIRGSPHPINSKMSHGANQLIFKLINIQQFSSLVLVFKDIL